MSITPLSSTPESITKNRVKKRFLQCQELIAELQKKDIPEALLQTLNTEIDTVNSTSSSDPTFGKKLRKAQAKIVKLIEKELKLVTQNHYRNMWLALGMTFGLPIGAAIGLNADNMSLVGIGLPLGMAFGIVYGMSLDKKAAEQGNQLKVEIKY